MTLQSQKGISRRRGGVAAGFAAAVAGGYRVDAGLDFAGVKTLHGQIGADFGKLARLLQYST